MRWFFTFSHKQVGLLCFILAFVSSLIGTCYGWLHGIGMLYLILAFVSGLIITSHKDIGLWCLMIAFVSSIICTTYGWMDIDCPASMDKLYLILAIVSSLSIHFTSKNLVGLYLVFALVSCIIGSGLNMLIHYEMTLPDLWLSNTHLEFTVPGSMLLTAPLIKSALPLTLVLSMSSWLSQSYWDAWRLSKILGLFLLTVTSLVYLT